MPGTLSTASVRLAATAVALTPGASLVSTGGWLVQAIMLTPATTAKEMGANLIIPILLSEVLARFLRPNQNEYE